MRATRAELAGRTASPAHSHVSLYCLRHDRLRVHRADYIESDSADLEDRSRRIQRVDGLLLRHVPAGRALGLRYFRCAARSVAPQIPARLAGRLGQSPSWHGRLQRHAQPPLSRTMRGQFRYLRSGGDDRTLDRSRTFAFSRDFVLPPRKSSDVLPLDDASCDLVLLAFVAHELRRPAARAAFFAELHRVLRPGGCVALLEHFRSAPIWLAFGPKAARIFTRSPNG